VSDADPRLRYAVEVSCLIVARFAERVDAEAFEAKQRAAGRVGLRILDRGGPESPRLDGDSSHPFHASSAPHGIGNAPIVLGPGHRS
jgi:hypothetical protein